MELDFDVQMNTSVLYDYMLNHTYKTFSGIFWTFCCVVIIMISLKAGAVTYAIIGFVALLYMPINLYIASRQRMLLNPAFKAPLHYHLSKDGVEMSQGEIKEGFEWTQVAKAISTPKSIILYTEKNVATILPRADLGDRLTDALQIISANVEPKKIKIRY